MGLFEGRYTQDNLGVKKVSAPSKNPLKCPSMFFAPDKKNYLLHFESQRYIGIFMSHRERGRGERERAREQDQERERKIKRKRKKKRKREREKKVRTIIFLNCLGQSEKSAKYW
jgi:hypothetical protein